MSSFSQSGGPIIDISEFGSEIPYKIKNFIQLLVLIFHFFIYAVEVLRVWNPMSATNLQNFVEGRRHKACLP